MEILFIIAYIVLCWLLGGVILRAIDNLFK
jgi:hypothetical protein